MYICVYTCIPTPPISMIVYVVCEFVRVIHLFFIRRRLRFDEDFNGGLQCYFLVLVIIPGLYIYDRHSITTCFAVMDFSDFFCNKDFPE